MAHSQITLVSIGVDVEALRGRGRHGSLLDCEWDVSLLQLQFLLVIFKHLGCFLVSFVLAVHTALLVKHAYCWPCIMGIFLYDDPMFTLQFRVINGYLFIPNLVGVKCLA